MLGGLGDLFGLVTARRSATGLPRGHYVELPGRGRTYVWDLGGPAGAPTVILLHGLMATGGVNWFPAIPPLAREFRVVALDLRGHGRAQPVGLDFELADCADDVVALADVLGIDRFIAAGYSLGGPVAQLLWYRHPDRLAGLVLCATSRNFGGTVPERVFFSTLAAGVLGLQVGRQLPFPWRSRSAIEAASTDGDAGRKLAAVAEALAEDGADEPREHDRDPFLPEWALAQLRRTNVLSAVKALTSVGRFSSHQWAGGIAVPTAVVVTTHDHLVATSRQLKLAEAIPDSVVYRVPAGHAACVLGARVFVPALVEACRWVAERSGLDAATAVDASQDLDEDVGA